MNPDGRKRREKHLKKLEKKKKISTDDNHGHICHEKRLLRQEIQRKSADKKNIPAKVKN
jgi:hypothetical protein